jgi:hypothetical protein
MKATITPGDRPLYISRQQTVQYITGTRCNHLIGEHGDRSEHEVAVNMSAKPVPNLFGVELRPGYCVSDDCTHECLTPARDRDRDLISARGRTPVWTYNRGPGIGQYMIPLSPREPGAGSIE